MEYVGPKIGLRWASEPPRISKLSSPKMIRSAHAQYPMGADDFGWSVTGLVDDDSVHPEIMVETRVFVLGFGI